MKKPKHIKKNKYWRYIRLEDGTRMVGLFSWPDNKLIARYGLHTQFAKKHARRINPEQTHLRYPEAQSKRKRRERKRRCDICTTRPKYPGGYKERVGALRRLGMRSYGMYLRSKLWKAIKQCLLPGRACAICGQPATLLHHRDYTYETLRGDNPTSLVPLCYSCHYRIEFRGGDKIMDVYEVNERLNKAIAGHAFVDETEECTQLNREFCEIIGSGV